MTIRTLETSTIFFKLNLRCCGATPLRTGLQDGKWGQYPFGGAGLSWGRGSQVPGHHAAMS